MHQKSLAVLEYPKVLERLVAEAAFSASKELAAALEPVSDSREVRQRLALTTEARRLLDARPDLGVRGARDIRRHVSAAERGAMLHPDELLEVLATVRAAEYVSRTVRRQESASFPLIGALANDLPVRTQLEARIAECISEEGEVLDSASPDLRRLRAEIRGAQQRLQERLGTLVNEFRTALQEPIITMRGDRYVLPVKAESRGSVRGIVHDQSGSGATVFVEPLVVVEMNNRLRQLQIAERQEIERILSELSEAVGREAAYLRLAVQLLAEIDLALAKARLAAEMRASEPIISTNGRLDLRQARHPLLKGKVVPIDFYLGGDQARMVVITGPNTGGKTVALKTVGLFCLMAQAGLHIPAQDGSEVPIFDDIFADIGDEQSIEQSLSTFSSHLSRIIEILRLADSGSLVLLDELGAGTDPSEGSALARAILVSLRTREIATVATTHYSELKVFAHDTPGVANASVDFDVETLSPTYHLSVGLPGRSNALAIAARLGLPEDIITSARELLGTAGLEMENLLQGLQAERKVAADEAYKLSMERAEAEYQRREFEHERARLEEERVRVLNEARAQARADVEAVQAELARIRAEVRRGGLGEQRIAGLRTRARTLDEQVAPIGPRIRVPREEPQEAPGPLTVGDAVYIRSMDQHGELLSLPNARGEVEVRMGALKLRVPTEQVVRLSRRQMRTGGVPATTVTLEKRPETSAPDLQIDLRGWRVEDALEEVDRYLDNAVLAGMPFVRLLHGKGTGALRQAIRQHLTGHPHVRKLASAEANDGGDGITIVTLAS